MKHEQLENGDVFHLLHLWGDHVQGDRSLVARITFQQMGACTTAHNASAGRTTAHTQPTGARTWVERGQHPPSTLVDSRH